MSKEKWTELKTRQFVMSYLQKPTLWNSGIPEYCQKSMKERAYNELMREFALSLPEVRNKIRIFRTTYNQEKKKEETIINYKPKLSWYQEMKNAFETGKIKSFSKTPSKIKIEVHNDKDNLINYEYDTSEMHDESDERDERVSVNRDQQIIIEPYDEYEDEEDEQEQEIEIIKSKEEPSSSQILSSNELFLHSLKSTLDKLSDEKNMRARIAIQEVLYKIMYEK